MKKLIRIEGRLRSKDAKRFKSIQREMGFHSVYEIMNYLCYVFLRVVDSENDIITDDIPSEIKQMFNDLNSPDIPKRFFVKKEEKHR